MAAAETEQNKFSTWPVPKLLWSMAVPLITANIIIGDALTGMGIGYVSAVNSLSSGGRGSFPLNRRPGLARPTDCGPRIPADIAACNERKNMLS